MHPAAFFFLISGPGRFIFFIALSAGNGCVLYERLRLKAGYEVVVVVVVDVDGGADDGNDDKGGVRSTHSVVQ